MPAPAEWVNVRRIRVKDSVEYIYWLSASEFPKADNNKSQEHQPPSRYLAYRLPLV
jgi:site-specific DNA-methyltransferase (cytosine-N4-specific)